MHSSTQALDDYRTTRRALDGNPEDVDALLGALGAHRSGVLWAGLEHVRAHSDEFDDRARARLAKALLSARVDRLSPELQVVLLDAIEQLADALSPADVTSWRRPRHATSDLDVRAELVALMTAPSHTLERWLDEDYPPRSIITYLKPHHLRPRPELLELLRDTFPRDLTLQHELVTLCVEAVESDNFPLYRGRQYLVDALATPHTELQSHALAELARPWALLAASSHDRLIATMRELTYHHHEHVSRAAIAWLGRAHDHDTLELLLRDERLSVPRQRAVIEEMATCAHTRDIDELLAITRAHRMDLAPALFATLLTMHHRGEYITREHVPTLVELFDELRPCTPATWHAITFTSRGHVLELLSARGLEDAAWGHALVLLEHLEGAEPLIASLLRSLQDVRLLGELARMARSLALEELEQALLSRCPTHPALMLPALVTCGGAHTRDMLQAALEESAPWIIPHQQLAASLVWHLSPHARDRQDLIHRYHVTLLPESVRHTLAELDDDRIAKLIAHAQNHTSGEAGHAHAAFIMLCQHARPSHMPALAQTLCALVTFMEAWHVHHEHERTFTRETTLDEDIIAAIEALGARWFAQKRLRPACIPLSWSATDASRDLVNSLIIEVLDGPLAEKLAPHHQRILLSAMKGPLGMTHTRRLKSLIWTKDVHVRKALVRALARSHDPGVMAWYGSLLEHHDDIETVRQVLLALHERGGAWASQMVAGVLEHRNMNIKITAARALAEISDVHSVPRLLFWLGHHDHDTFRGALTRALERALGKGWRAAIRASITQETDARRRYLLERAITRHDAATYVREQLGTPDEHQDPAAWWRAMRAATPAQRAARLHELELSTQPTEVALAHIDELLSWCAHEALAPHRAAALRWVTHLAPSASRPHRLAMITPVRALPTLTHTDTLDRLDCLQMLGATLTPADHVQLLTDARHGERPHALLASAVHRLTNLWPRSSEDERVEAASQTLLDGDDHAFASRLEALPSHLHRELEAHLAIRMPELEEEIIRRVLEFLARPRHTRHVEPRHRPDESIGVLLDTLEHPDTEPGDLKRTLDKLMSRRLSGELEVALLSMMLEHPALDHDISGHITPLLARHVHHEVVDAHIAHASPEALGRIMDAVPNLPNEVILVSLDRWLALWRRDDLDEEVHDLLDKRLGRLPAMTLLGEIIDDIEHGELGLTDLLRGPLSESPLYTRLIAAFAHHAPEDRTRRARIEELHTPYILSGRNRALEELLPEPRTPTHTEEVMLATQQEYFHALSTLQAPENDFEAIAALRTLRHHEVDSATAQLIFDTLIGTRSPRLRSTAWRTLRAVEAREHYLDASTFMMSDDRQDVQASAIKVVGHARHEPAIPKLIELYHSPSRRTRALVAQALGLMPGAAHQALLKILPRTRPDRREALHELLDKIEQDPQ